VILSIGVVFSLFNKKNKKIQYLWVFFLTKGGKYGKIQTFHGGVVAHLLRFKSTAWRFSPSGLKRNQRDSCATDSRMSFFHSFGKE